MDIFHGPWNNHAEWLDPINAGVRAVESAGRAVEAHFALNGFLEVAFKSLALQSMEVSRHAGIVRLAEGGGKGRQAAAEMRSLFLIGLAALEQFEAFTGICQRFLGKFRMLDNSLLYPDSFIELPRFGIRSGERVFVIRNVAIGEVAEHRRVFDCLFAVAHFRLGTSGQAPGEAIK